ncbi:GSU2403 family nucleotidyltransferase fold protein [Devosia sp.]|uniref:nucleotidyltransferase family protein n=1 Tax=Devosia sp. TaxID=1871048 RepID=UPI003BA9F3DA
MSAVDLSYQVLYSELAQRSLDASFTSEFSLDGRFISMESRGRRYWYFDTAKRDGKPGSKRRIYVGPVDDEEINRRVATFKDLKADYRARMRLVATLVREAYLPRPDPVTGEVIDALAQAGFFRMRGVLVGTVAFQSYAALLGVRIFSGTMQTGDVDFALFHSIANAVDDSMPPILELLRNVDPTFREVPHRADGRFTTQYVTRTGYKVEFLTPNTSSNDYSDKPARMPALGDTAAQPLRFLDFLIHQPVRAVVLHGAGVPVLVPAPERYAIHKLIVASRRLADDDGMAKSRKDLAQAHKLIHTMVAQHTVPALADAFMEAWDRGPHWRDALRDGINMLGPAEAVRKVLADGVVRLGADPAKYELSTP